MTSQEDPRQEDAVLVVASDEKSRAAITAAARGFGINAIPCATFAEAQERSLSTCCRGILVELTTMIKTRDAEKIIAHTLTSIYPTLRVKSMGPILIPMIMAGDAKQDKSLNDFFVKTCATFTPRRLRSSKRREICIPTSIGAERGFTLNISWGGVFIVDVAPERFSVGQELTVRFLSAPDPDFSAELTVVRIQPWGERSVPGLGLRFKQVDQELEGSLFKLLRSDREKDHDRFCI